VAEIMDVRLPEAEERYIRDIILEHHPEVRGFHHLRTRRSGSTRYIELHLLVDPAKTIQEVHNLCDHLEGDIMERLPSAVITMHTEPDDGRYRGPLDSDRDT
jgi:divalent metal cation (Fe/Co/Zn/Cd) transporter